MPTLAEIHTLLAHGDRRTAQRDLARLLKNEPANVDAWLLLARLVEDHQRKVDCYRQVIELDPANQSAQAALEWLYIQPALEMDLPEPLPPDLKDQPVEAVPVQEALPEAALFDWLTLTPTYPVAPEVNEEVLEPVIRLRSSRRRFSWKAVVIPILIVLFLAGAAFGIWWFLIHKTTPVVSPAVTPTHGPAISDTSTPEASPTATAVNPQSLPIPTDLDLRIVWAEPDRLMLWDRGQTTTLTKVDATTTAVALSSDRQFAAFNRSGGIWVINIQAAESERVIVRPVALPKDDLPASGTTRTPQQFVWLPGRHTFLFNTVYTPAPGSALPCDDLFSAEYETGTVTRLLPCGQGGSITLSADGKLAALVSADNLRIYDLAAKKIIQTFPYDPVTLPSAESFHVQPVWEADSQALLAAIPPADAASQPNTPTRLWKIPVDSSPVLLGEVYNASSTLQFSPDTSHLVYVFNPSVPQPASGEIHLANPDASSDSILFAGAAGMLLGWSADGKLAAVSLSADPPELWLVNAADGLTRQLSLALPSGSRIIHLAWLDNQSFVLETSSPSGERLWFGSTSSLPVMLAESTSTSPLPFSAQLLP